MRGNYYKIRDLDITISDGNYSSKYPKNEEFVSEGIPFIRANNLVSGSIDDTDMYFITKEKHEILLKGHLKSGDVLLTTRGNIGQVAIVPERHNDSNINAQIVLLRVNNEMEISNRYLLWALQAESAKRQYEQLQTGTALKQLPVSRLEEVCICFPLKDEQDYIASSLDKVEKLITLRKQQLSKLDELVKARFVELFGNPLDGTAKYPIHQVGEVAEAVDPQPSHRTPPIEEGGIPYVSIKDCDYKTGTIDFDGARRVSRKVLEEHLNRYTLQDGDFVIGKIGTIGKPVFVPARNDYTLSANVVLVQPNNELVSPYFLKYSFESDFVERQFSEAKNSTSQAAFGIQKVRAVEVMNPDLDIQRAFERFVKQTDKSKLAVQKSLEQLETLKKALMQQYFG